MSVFGKLRSCVILEKSLLTYHHFYLDNFAALTHLKVFHNMLLAVRSTFLEKEETNNHLKTHNYAKFMRNMHNSDTIPSTLMPFQHKDSS